MPGKAVREQVVTRARRIVVKVGTNAICDDRGRLDLDSVASLARQIAKVRSRGVSVVLVASGAIGSGVRELDLPARPKTMPQLQAAAAVGQGQLMRHFHDVFARYGLKVAQVLLTRDDFENRARYLNIRNTLRSLEDFGALPIVNENDTVAVDEIRFGENDILAALVTAMLGAQVLVLLTSVDGLIKDGQVQDVVREVDESVLALASSARSKLGSGGMKSKLQAAQLVVRSGEVAVIANARCPDVLTRLLDGEPIGTVFVPADRKMSSRARWIAGASRPAGKIVVDEGAASALVKHGKSLLPSGIIGVLGRFEKGATVSVVDPAGRQIARGLTNYSSAGIEQIKGLKTSQIAKVLGDKPYDEIIHRNNMIVG